MIFLFSSALEIAFQCRRESLESFQYETLPFHIVFIKSVNLSEREAGSFLQYRLVAGLPQSPRPSQAQSSKV